MKKFGFKLFYGTLADIIKEQFFGGVKHFVDLELRNVMKVTTGGQNDKNTPEEKKKRLQVVEKKEKKKKVCCEWLLGDSNKLKYKANGNCNIY